MKNWQFKRSKTKIEKRTKKILFESICFTCGTRFPTTRRNKFFCRDSCKTMNYYHGGGAGNVEKIIQRVCPQCGKIISISTLNGDLKRIFCDLMCESEYKRTHRKKRVKKENKKKPKLQYKVNINTVCEKCKQKIIKEYQNGNTRSNRIQKEI